MATDKSFEVIVRRKIPYLTDFVYNLLIICAFILVIQNVFLLPTEHQSGEMKVAYYILVVPEFVQKAFIFSGIGFLTFLVLHRFLRLHKTATLTFLPDQINIVGKRLVMTIPISRISRVFCMDAKNLAGESKEKMTFYFEQKSKKTIRIRLKYYLETDEFMENLIQYENINFKFFDFDVSPNLEVE
jgi:hypothetical protein